jgi:tRNA 2-thiouridine synthesizing protein A
MSNSNIKTYTFDESIDVLGLTCPKPLLHTKKKLSSMNSGQVLQIILDDNKSLEDFGYFCNAAGHVLIASVKSNNGHYTYIYIRKV